MSGGFAKFTEQGFQQAKAILQDVNGYDFNTAEKIRLMDSLIKGKFIIDEETNELEILKMRYWKGKFNTYTFGLNILPTLRCNFRCTYCYEKKKYGDMSNQTVDNIKKLAERKLSVSKLFCVSWFGGEPLLRFDVIEDLSDYFLKICKEKEAQYYASLTTNGYLLNEKKINMLEKIGIKVVQVTFDGLGKFIIA
jgi:uncharacterized protein